MLLGIRYHQFWLKENLRRDATDRHGEIAFDNTPQTAPQLHNDPERFRR